MITFHNYVTIDDRTKSDAESHPLATKTNGKICTIPLPASIPFWTLHLACALGEKEKQKYYSYRQPHKERRPEFSIPLSRRFDPTPCIVARRATTFGDSATWQFYVVARWASTRRRNRIYYPPLRYGIGGGDVCSNLIESNRTIIEPDRLLSREASDSADATVRCDDAVTIKMCFIRRTRCGRCQ